MNLTTLYRSLSPHAGQAKSLVAEASSLSISALADLCEEHNLPCMTYWRNTAKILAAVESFSDLKPIQFQRFRTTLQFENLVFPCLLSGNLLKSQTRIYLVFNCAGTRYIHTGNRRGTHSDTYTPNTHNIQTSPKHRLILARRVAVCFEDYFTYFDQAEAMYKHWQEYYSAPF